MIQAAKNGKAVSRMVFFRPIMSMVVAANSEPIMAPIRGMTASHEPSSFVMGMVEFSLRSWWTDGDGQPECMPLVIMARVAVKEMQMKELTKVMQAVCDI